jgi:hypothetical protein
MITGTILKKLQRKGLVKLTTIINASVWLKHVPASWKVSEVIMLPKPGKKPHRCRIMSSNCTVSDHVKRKIDSETS